MNRGDAFYLSLDITLDGKPIVDGYADDIELTINPQSNQACVQKSLLKGDLVWDLNKNCYTTYLSQQDTYRMREGINTWQLRVLKEDIVTSTTFGEICLGKVNSREVLVNETD